MTQPSKLVKFNRVRPPLVTYWSTTACCYGGAARMHFYETDMRLSEVNQEARPSHQVKQGVPLRSGMVVDICG